MSRFRLVLATGGLLLYLNFLGAALVQAGKGKGFRDQREEFRKRVETKQEKEIEGAKDLYAVYFPEDTGRFRFSPSSEEAGRLVKFIGDFYDLKDEMVLNRLLLHLGDGGIIIGKRYSRAKEGVTLKAAFLIPPYPYWERLTNVDGIEDTFAVYNTSVELYAEGITHYCFLQTEGTFFGVTRAVNLPLVFFVRKAEREFAFRMPNQEEIDRVARMMRPVNPGRSKPREKFVDHCRRHPLFSERNEKGEFRIRDKDILKIYKKVFDLDECEVKVTEGRWKIIEDFSEFYLVEYLLRSVVNVEAFVPNIPLVRGLVEKFAQKVSDEVSVKYLPLSMKNLRDWVVEDHQKRVKSKK